MLYSVVITKKVMVYSTATMFYGSFNIIDPSSPVPENPPTEIREETVESFVPFKRAKEVKKYLLTQPEFLSVVIRKHIMEGDTLKEVIGKGKIFIYGQITAIKGVSPCHKCEEISIIYAIKGSQTILLFYCSNCSKRYIARSGKTPVEKRWLKNIRLALATK